MAGDPKDERIRVAVLGGGAGALSAVWGLVNSPDGDRYEITVYQMGWRLGGKARSGRNRECADRIEEGAAQLWSGAYHNAFRMMRQVYRELDRPADAPLSSWYDAEHPERSAFLPQDQLGLSEFQDGRWQHWSIEFPHNAELPGTAAALPVPRSTLESAVEWLGHAFADPALWDGRHQPAPANRSGGLFEAGRLVLESSPLLRAARSTADALSQRALARQLETALAAIHELPVRPGRIRRDESEAILEPLDEFAHAVTAALEPLAETRAPVRRALAGLELCIALIRGLLDDQLFERGFDAVDGEELSAWFTRHGASTSNVESMLERGLHAFFFAAPAGDASRPSLSAASGLRTLVRTGFGYAGAFAWQAQAALGEVVFAPLYEVLSRRPNVRFEFFHVVEELRLERDGAPTDAIQSIQLGRQVGLDDGIERYEPLYDVQGLPCWPNAPLDEQLDPKQAKTLREYRIDLESAWSPWPPREIVELEKGRDFDVVVLGIPPGALADATHELCTHIPGWEKMLHGLPSVATGSLTLWLEQRLEQRERPEAGIGLAAPFSRWASRDRLIARERWETVRCDPRAAVTLCGVVPEGRELPAPPAQWFPEEQKERLLATATSWLMSNAGTLWPRLARPGTVELDWSQLSVTADEPRGPSRLAAQHWQLELDPTQRSLLSLPGTLVHRPRADQFPIRNLVLAGDWLRTGFNIACFEAAVMGGLQASRAICGWPKRIVGDDDFIVSGANGD